MIGADAIAAQPIAATPLPAAAPTTILSTRPGHRLRPSGERAALRPMHRAPVRPLRP